MHNDISQNIQYSAPFFVTLKNRGLIHIEGSDRHKFLQDLITNDVTALKNNTILYACLLTPQGKFLFDFFIHEGGTKQDGFLLLDCEGGERAQELYKRLRMYCLRKDVQISVEENAAVYAVFNAEIGIADPREKTMGYRSFEKPQNIEEKPFDVWDTHRISLQIPDGSRDMIPEKSTLMESGIDKLNGISFEKGCYIGQELTARMHYRGLAKKHMQTVYAQYFGGAFPPYRKKIKAEGKTIGEMRSSCGHIGLALMKKF